MNATDPMELTLEVPMHSMIMYSMIEPLPEGPLFSVYEFPLINDLRKIVGEYLLDSSFPPDKDRESCKLDPTSYSKIISGKRYLGQSTSHYSFDYRYGHIFNALTPLIEISSAFSNPPISYELRARIDQIFHSTYQIKHQYQAQSTTLKPLAYKLSHSSPFEVLSKKDVQAKIGLKKIAPLLGISLEDPLPSRPPEKDFYLLSSLLWISFESCSERNGPVFEQPYFHSKQSLGDTRSGIYRGFEPR